MPDANLWTIGHSNRAVDELRQMLLDTGIELLVDVRAFPGSRRQPHFGREAWAASLDEVGIAYRHVRDLGGRRRGDASSPDSVAGAWRHDSFRAYAQWTQGAGFQEALALLLGWAAEQPPVILCSEAVPWRCHRWLVSDCATARHARVLHVIDAGPEREHLLSPFAVVDPDARVRWPGPRSALPLRLGPAVAVRDTPNDDV
jgi:uncharacterized protein (DUF488 family)